MENNKLINQSHETYSQIRNTLITAQTKMTAGCKYCHGGSLLGNRRTDISYLW